MKKLLAVALSLSLVACASTPDLIVGGDPTKKVPLVLQNPTVITDLQSAAYNLDNAVAVGALLADDPAPACVHAVLKQAGVEVDGQVVEQKSFVPKKDGLASAGSIAYILAQQAKRGLGVKPVVPMDCKALIGTLVIDGIEAAKSAVPVIRLLK